MIKFHVLSILFTFFLTVGLSQKSKDIYYLNITKYTDDLEMSEPNFLIKEIVDNSEISGDYGFVQTGFSNKYKKVIFRNGISTDLIKYVNERYYENPYGVMIKMEIVKLIISEKSSFLEKGKVTVHIRYYHNGEIVSSYDHMTNHKTWGDITKRNIKVLDKMLNSSLVQLSNAIKDR